ncbi:MAG: peptidoglycan-binding protein [candidate division Zixibacteria bacterium]|nr:peptidoglycan-binding protein [candidate division Zixibacteria bacterium]
MYAVRLDGLFGRNTEDAVMRFQRAHGLVDDGVVGPVTWAALLGDAAGATNCERTPPAVSIPGPVAIARSALQAELAEAAQYRVLAVEAGRGRTSARRGQVILPNAATRADTA